MFIVSDTVRLEYISFFNLITSQLTKFIFSMFHKAHQVAINILESKKYYHYLVQKLYVIICWPLRLVVDLIQIFLNY